MHHAPRAWLMEIQRRVRCSRRNSGSLKGFARTVMPALCLQAKLHARLGQRDQAAHYHKLNLDRIDAEGISGQDAVEALTFLAEYHQVG